MTLVRLVPEPRWRQRRVERILPVRLVGGYMLLRRLALGGAVTLVTVAGLAGCSSKGAAGGGASDGGGGQAASSGSGGTGLVGSGGTGLVGSGGTGLTGSGGSPTTDPADPGKQPPAPGGGSVGTGTTPTVLAIRRVFLGETNTSGQPDPNAWANYGFNLDGLLSTKTGSNHCTLQPNTPPANKADGTAGTDNSFGKNVVAILKTLVPSPSDDTSLAIEQGGATVLLKLDNLDNAPNQTNINAAVYKGAALQGSPAWNGSDVRAVLPDSVNGGNVNDPRVKLPNSYVSNGTWVGASAGLVELRIAIGGFPITLAIVKAVITMVVSAGGGAANGIISGLVRTEQLVTEFEKAAGYLTAGQLCPGNPTLEGAAIAIRQTSDIMSDGSNGDPAKHCDAISVAIGFEASPVQLGGVATPSPPPPDPCAT